MVKPMTIYFNKYVYLTLMLWLFCVSVLLRKKNHSFFISLRNQYYYFLLLLIQTFSKHKKPIII